MSNCRNVELKYKYKISSIPMTNYIVGLQLDCPAKDASCKEGNENNVINSVSTTSDKDCACRFHSVTVKLLIVDYFRSLS